MIVTDSFTDQSQGAGERTCHYSRGRNEAILMIANGSDGAFSSGYQPLIDFVLQHFQELPFTTASHTIPEDLSRKCESLRVAMQRHFPCTDDWLNTQFSATYLISLIYANSCFTSWLGNFQIKLYRQGLCLSESSPHILNPPITKQGGGLLVVATKTATTVPCSEQFNAETLEPWQLEAGDILVIADSLLFLLDRSGEISKIVSSSQPHPAKRLVDWAQSIQFTRGQSALVARIT